MKYYTYIHYRKDNNKPFYVGEGSNNRATNKRIRNQEWKKVVDTVGYSVEIMSRFETEEEALAHEAFLIETLTSIGHVLTNVAAYGNDTINILRRNIVWEKKRKEARNSVTAIAAHKEKMLKWKFTATNVDTGEVTTFLGAKEMRQHPLKFDYAKACLCASGERKLHKRHTWIKEKY